MRTHFLGFILVFFIETHADSRGSHFIGYEKFSEFQQGTTETGKVLLSERITPPVSWDQLVASWNFRGAPTQTVTIEARAFYPNHETKWYILGRWALQPAEPSARASVKNQKDKDGTVDTDVLKLNKPATSAQLRITFEGGAALSTLSFLGISFCDSTARQETLPANKSIWGNALQVTERSQANYPDGINEWCSPTSLSMLMSYWSKKLNRPDLEYDVPDVARGVNDPNWPGTGNWPFNTAFAGAHKGIRAYVTRLSDVSELEDWIEAGIPLAVSVSYGYLKGRAQKANGHLVVCIGFDESGNIIVNDPGRSHVRQVYLRENLVRAWAESENTVYVVYPEGWTIPSDRFGHWHSK
jgi:hypothetical protein